VAVAAGVSPTTVSHVLNEVPSARISPETRDRVRAMAARLGYGPNSVARALRTSRTALLGLIIEDAGDNPQAGQLILGADRAARARGYHLLVITTSTSETPGAREADVGSLLRRGVDGILYAPRHPRPHQLPDVGPVPVVPVVTVDSGSSTPAEKPDHDDGAPAAVDQSAERGEQAARAARAAGILIDAIEEAADAHLPPQSGRPDPAAGPPEVPAQ
jgi:LacI family transcriptional regulator